MGFVRKKIICWLMHENRCQTHKKEEGGPHPEPRGNIPALALQRSNKTSLLWYQGASQVVQLVNNMPANEEDTRDVGSTPGSGRSLGEGNDNPVQYYCLGNSMDRGAWQAAGHVVTKSQTPLSVHACTHTHTHTHTHTYTPMVASGCLPGQFILSHHHEDKGKDCEFLENTIQAVLAITTSMQPIQADSSWLIQWMLINNTHVTVLIHVNNAHIINII